MHVQDEYKCRRCGHTFFSPIQIFEADPDEDLLTVCASRTLDGYSWSAADVQAHICQFGGVGIGEWIGAREVKDKSET